jgi:hypothetical protein
VLAHHFRHQHELGGVAQLVGHANVNAADALPPDLPDGENPPAFDVLAQQHAEGRRRRRVLFLEPGQLEAGEAGVGREQQPVVCAAGVYEQRNLVGLGLVDLADAAGGQLAAQLGHHCSHDGTVKSHEWTPLLIKEGNLPPSEYHGRRRPSTIPAYKHSEAPQGVPCGARHHPCLS